MNQLSFIRSSLPHGAAGRPSKRAAATTRSTWRTLLTSITLAASLAGVGSTSALAGDSSAAAQLQRWSAEAGAPGNAAKGQTLFTTKHGGEWSCASCHGQPPTQTGKHASTGKAIEPLAPAFNAKAFTDAARSDKWFRRNCKDVLSRECTAAEKADVLAYLINLK